MVFKYHGTAAATYRGNASYGINVGNIEGKIEKTDNNTCIYEDGENLLQLVQVNIL